MNNRAAHRLAIAARLLHLPEHTDVLDHINAMPQAERDHLRGLVDWVEDYEREEEQRQKKKPCAYGS